MELSSPKLKKLMFFLKKTFLIFQQIELSSPQDEQNFIYFLKKKNSIFNFLHQNFLY